MDGTWEYNEQLNIGCSIHGSKKNSINGVTSGVSHLFESTFMTSCPNIQNNNKSKITRLEMSMGWAKVSTWPNITVPSPSICGNFQDIFVM